jgi:predicted transposase YbfD/YdcC
MVGFPGARTIAKLVRRVRRKNKVTTETVYLISSLTLAEMDARGLLKHKRLYWVIESRLHHPLDISLDEDHSRVRHPNAALVLAMFRRLTVSLALHWVDQSRAQKRRGTVRGFQKRFHHRQTGPQRLSDLVFTKQPTAWASID